MRTPSISSSKAAAIAIAAILAVIFAIGFWLIVAKPLADEYAKIADLKSGIRGLETQRRRLGGAERWVQAKAEAGALRGVLFNGAAAAANIAQLQGVMRVTASDAGLTVISAQPYSPGDGGDAKGVIEIGVRMTLSGELSQFADFLYALSEEKPIVVVDGVDLRTTAGASDSQALNATISAVGFSTAAAGES